MLNGHLQVEIVIPGESHSIVKIAVQRSVRQPRYDAVGFSKLLECSDH